MLESARDYIFRRMPSIRGYLGVVDALAIATIIIGQKDAQFRGSVAEIGVYFGRSFLLMATLINANEKALAADLFEIGPKVGEDSWQLASFLKSAEALHIFIDRETLFVGNSRDLTATLLLPKSGPLRFFSIDGGHSLADVLSDAELAAQTSSEFGVICFDDFCNPEWPEVTLGVFEFLRKHEGHFVPFMISQKKLFVCRKEYRHFYAELVNKSVLLRTLRAHPVNIVGSSSIFIKESIDRRIRYEMLVRCGLSRINALFY